MAWNTGDGSVSFNTNAFVPENIKTLHDQNFKVVLHVNRAPRNLSSTEPRPSASVDIRSYCPVDLSTLPLYARAGPSAFLHHPNYGPKDI